MSLNHQKEYNRDIRNWLLKVLDYTAYLSKKKLVRRICPVCGSDNSTFFANNGFLNYETCKECSLIYMNPAVDAEAVNNGFKGDDDILMEYFNIIMKYKTDMPTKPNPITDNKLIDIYHAKQSGSLLDVGCSVGDFLHKASYFYQVEGVEVNPFTAAVAEKYFKIHKKYLAELELNTQYDIVTLHQILYGVPDPVSLLKDIYKVLKDDGVLYINTPNADSNAVQLYKGQVNHLHGYTTLNVFNKKSLEQAATIAGFRMVSFRTEWLDIYTTDIIEYLNRPEKFIHKRNCYVEDYEEKIKKEDELHKQMALELSNKGNYLIAILEKV